jgi:fibronectin type 3 domain-containing protein
MGVPSQYLPLKKQEELRMKGIKKALCLLVLLFSVALALPVTANASTNGHTAQEALAWTRAQLGKSLDYDGVYGAQCVDLIKYYYEFLGCASYARGNGCDYATNALPSGWARYQGAQPQPGDILVYSATSEYPYGHVAIYEADRVTYHQNLNYVQKVVCYNYHYNTMANPYWGVIRPDFASSPSQATWEGPTITSVTETNATVAGKVTFNQKMKTTSAGMRLYDGNGNFLTYYKPDTTNYNSTYVTFDFNINTELYYTLSPGKTYRVQFYTMSGGREYTSSATTFTTPHTHSYRNGACTICGARDPNLKLATPKVKSGYLTASGKPYLQWGAISGAEKYYVFRSTSKNGTYSILGSTANLNYTDSKATAGTTYYYKVKAGIVNGVKSASSTAVSVTCHCAKPTVKATYMGATGKPYIKWNAVANASKYEVYRATSKEGTYTLLGTTTATNYTDNKAGTGYTYYYKVRAISKVKSSANSAFSTVVTGICHCARPTVKITTSAGKPRLTWNAVAGASKYEVYRATSKNGTYTKMYTTTRTSYTNTSAKAGTTYYYKVKAVSKVKSSANSVFSTVVSIRVR